MSNTLKKSMLCAFFLLVTSTFIYAQTGSIRGFVYTKKTGEPVIFTNVYLAKSTYGSTTDVNGFFNISKVPAGNYTLMVTYLGYDTLAMPITINKGEIITEKLYLEESLVKLDIVEISAESIEAKTETRTSVVKVSPKQISQIPTIGGQADIAQYLQVVPGVVFTGDQGGQLYIRGGSPVQNKVMLDGMIVYNPFHSIGLFSVFDTDIIRNADIYTGGFNANYGGRISSVMDITTKDGNKKRLTGKLETNTFGANALLEGPLKKLDEKSKGSSSFIFSMKKSYLKESSKEIYDYIDTAGLPFNYTDLYGKLSFNGDNGSKANFFGFNYLDEVTDYKAVSKLKWNAGGAGGNFVVIPSGSDALIKANLAYSSYEIKFKELGLPEKRSSIAGFNGGIDFTYFFGDDEITYGLELIGFGTELEYYTTSNTKIEQNANNTEGAFFTKYKKKFEKLILEPGIRLQYYASQSTLSFEPRFAAKYIATDYLRIKLAAGRYSQNLISTRAKNNVVDLFYGFLSGPENLPKEFDGEEVKHKLQTAKDLIFGLEIDPFKHLTFNIEGYYKDFDQLSNLNSNKIFDDNEENATEPDIKKKDYIIETGEAYGVDFVAKYDYRRFYFWAVYSYGFVTRYDGVKEYYPFYDRRHNVNLLGTVTLGEDLNWEISARWNLGSGFPFAETLGMYEHLTIEDENTNVYTQNGDVKIIYDDENNGRLPYYHRLDVSVKRKFILGEFTSLEAVAGATNVYDRENIFYFDRVRYDKVNQLPLMPSVGLTFRF